MAEREAATEEERLVVAGAVGAEVVVPDRGRGAEARARAVLEEVGTAREAVARAAAMAKEAEATAKEVVARVAETREGRTVVLEAVEA